MLSRSSTDAGTRLRRSKSVSTVRRHHPSGLEPLHPRIAQHHAVAAATTAFARAHGAVERSEKRSSELSRAKSTSSRKSLTSEGSHFPPRESSVHSANRLNSTQAPTTQQPRAPTVTAEKFPSFYPTPGSDRPLSAQPLVAFNENVRPSSQPRSHRPSAASSITSQQIRKARSMYYASSVQTGSPIARPPSKYLTTPPPISVSTAPEILSPTLPGRSAVPSPLAPPQIPVIVEPGAAINSARDQCLQGFQQQHRQVQHRPSLFLASFKKRHDRAKAKERPISAGLLSASSSSRQTPLEPTMEPFGDFGMPNQKKEKRSFSNSIKDKFKKVFRRTSNNTTIMPVQQIEASRDYFNYQATPLSSKTFEVPSPDDETLLRARSRGSSLERMPSPLARPGSRGSTRSRGSNRSLHSETNATQLSSRVTSWSDSSAGNTLTQRDIKRLTVIHESKDSISSNAERSISSGSLRRKTVPLPSFTTFKDPMPMESLLEETSTPVDPKRVFSALMKEIDSTKAQSSQPAPSESSPSAESDVFESSTTKELHAMASRELHSSASREFRTSMSSDQRPVSRRRPNTAQSKTSSIRSLGRALISTIRTVTPIEQTSSPILEQTAVRVSPRPGTSASSNSTNSQQGTSFASIVQKKHARTGQRTAEDTLLQTVVTPNAGQLEQRMLRSNERWKTPLDEHQHHGPLHHRSHVRTISTSQFTDVAFRTPTTVVGIPALPELEGDSPKDTESQVTPVNTVSRSPRPNLVFSPLSPSIYSRNTDGISILPNDSVMSFDGTHDRQTNDDSGSAVIITSHAVKSYVIGTPSSRNKTESLRSSKDWKAWLSREVSELGSSLEGDITINDGYTPTIRNDSSTSGHHRELTQIEDDRLTIVARTSTDTRVHLPLSPTSSEGKDECGDKDRKLPTISHKGTPCDTDVNRKDEVVYTSDTKPEKRAMSPLVRTPAIRKDRHSSAHSHRSAKSRSSVSPPKSSTMNDRFPFIDTGRRTSINSARFSRSSRSATDSGSSTRSKCTPVSKVYSDVSAPVTVNWAPQPPLKTNSKEINESEQNKENIKGRVNPILTPATNLESLHSSAVFLSTLASEEDRPKSMLPLSSVKIDRSTPPLNEYAPTSEHAGLSKPTVSKPVQSSAVSSGRQRQRMRTTLSSISPKKLTTRPKSAFELRGKGALSLTPSALNAQIGLTDESSKERAGQYSTVTPDPPRVQLSGRSSGIDQDTLRMLLESPWAISDPPPSPRSFVGHADCSRTRPKLHIKHSSSTLALHREPSPGSEEQTIDTIIDGRPLSRRSNLSSVYGEEKGSGTGRITPGQRMVERYLKERSIPRGGGSGTPCSDTEHTSVPKGATGQTLEREDTPAFL